MILPYLAVVLGLLKQGADLQRPMHFPAPKDVNSEDNSVFGMIMEANGNSSTSRDGVELFQGDIIVTKEIRDELRGRGLYPGDQGNHGSNVDRSAERPKRAVMSNRNKRWIGRDGRPEIPYTLQRSVAHARGLIKQAMDHWTAHVPCLRFVERTNQKDFLSFFAGGGCYSNVGRVGSLQQVSIGKGCEHLAVVVHEIGHALGFWHEQMRPDRDEYVTIYWQNIQPGFRYAFEKVLSNKVNSMGIHYDYESVMHYNSKAFSKNGRVTIARKNGDTRLGNMRGLTWRDTEQAKMLYCGVPKATTPPVRPGGCRHTDNSKWCQFWASQGYCGSGSEYYAHMKENCKKSCLCDNFVVPTLPPCEDKNENCEAWARSRYCDSEQYRDYMRESCKKSCGLCNKNGSG